LAFTEESGEISLNLSSSIYFLNLQTLFLYTAYWLQISDAILSQFV
jgi:hypothetical protein